MAEPDDAPAPGQPPSILLGGEDEMEEDEAVPMAPAVETATVVTSDELISKIIAPSPYPHHITGPTSSRFRNALSRVTTNPYDVEAWQALMTEANACWRGIQPAVHNVDADTHAKLDWIESCYGSLLKHFPYASSYWETIIEVLLAQSSRIGEEGGPYMDYGPSQRAKQSEAKLERIFREILGIHMDGTPSDECGTLGGMCTSSVEVWLLYIKKRVRDANRQPIPVPEEKAKSVRELTIKAYEVAVEHTSFVYNNHIIWKQYLSFVKSWIPNPALNQDHALGQKQMLQLRDVYKRLVTHPMLGLDQLWQEYETFERGQNEALAAALIADFAPKYQHARNVYLDRNRVYTVSDLQMARLATPPADINDEDYELKISEEIRLLTAWKKRCAYERTNPERLSQDELMNRIRQSYKDFACALTRHPEVWHMWSTWELLQAGSKDAVKAECAVAVLQLGKSHIPDCTLLAHAESQVLELYTEEPEQCLKVMEAFLERCPNTLGFVLYQQMVRRYKGISDARAVFAKARRVLKETGVTKDDTAKAEGAGEEAEQEEGKDTAEVAVAAAQSGNRRMVTNRLDPSIGSVTKPEAEKETPQNGKRTGAEEESEKVVPGPVTWQLYASHATMEHRLNNAPGIAARVYELGLRKQMTFLTKAPYIMKYAQLLLELQDTENLRSLLTRAVAACEADGAKSDAAAALWDMTLRFESILSAGDPKNMSALKNVERRRHAALLGADLEDVSTGGLSGSDLIQIGGQKTSLSEQLVRTEGYDVSSNIVNGMSRALNVLEVMGLWGNDINPSSSRRKKEAQRSDSEEWSAGGKSDASYQRRLTYQMTLESGEPVGTAVGAETGTRILSARERLQTGAGSQGGQSSVVTIAIQQSPEWLRPMLLLLPASRMRTAILNKPPVQLVEAAVTSLITGILPAERPTDQGGAIPRKRQREGGDSDDEDNGLFGGGGYGSQFRARQKARQVVSAGQHNGGT
jgi:hypothetical protein